MTTNRRRAAVLASVALVLGGCGGGSPALTRTLPTDVVPAQLGALTPAREQSADDAFTRAGPASMVAAGGVWTARDGAGALVAALQVSVLEPKYDAQKIEIRRGVRANIETGRYRWTKIEGQWVGVQDLAETQLYLWFPPSGQLFEVMQVRRSAAEPQALLASVIHYQQGVGLR